MKLHPRSHLNRYRQIAEVLTRHGMGHAVGVIGLDRFVPVHRGLQRQPPHAKSNSGPRHLRKALEELGATFIKLGQILSTRSDLMPRVFVGRAVPHPILDVGGRLELTDDDRLPTIRCAHGVTSILPHYLASHAREGYNGVVQLHGSQDIRREHCAFSQTTQAKLRRLFGSYHKGDKLCKLSRCRRVEAVSL